MFENPFRKWTSIYWFVPQFIVFFILFTNIWLYFCSLIQKIAKYDHNTIWAQNHLYLAKAKTKQNSILLYVTRIRRQLIGGNDKDLSWLNYMSKLNLVEGNETSVHLLSKESLEFINRPKSDDLSYNERRKHSVFQFIH